MDILVVSMEILLGISPGRVSWEHPQDLSTYVLMCVPTALLRIRVSYNEHHTICRYCITVRGSYPMDWGPKAVTLPSELCGMSLPVNTS